MKILIAHNDYGHRSGEEHALETIAALLTNHGHDVVWLRRSSTEINASIAGKAKAFVTGVANPFAAREMNAALRWERPDVVFAQNLYPLLSPSILPPCRDAGIPLVMRCPNYRLFCPNGLHLSHGKVCERCLGGREYWCALRNCEGDLLKSAGYALRGWAARASGRILDSVNTYIVLSEFQRERFKAQGIEPQQLEILPNVTPVPSDPLASPSSWGSKGHIAFVGRASPEKGIEDFVEAARRLPDLSFAVAGDAERVRWLVNESPPNVRWCGFLAGPALDDFYRHSRMLVMPARWYEGFPNVVTHAMAMRKPVIASRIGALPEIVDHGRTGLTFEMGNVSELVQAITRLHGDEQLSASYGEAGWRKATTEYSSDVVYARLISILEKAVESTRMGKLRASLLPRA